MSKQTFIGFMVAFLVVIITVSLYYNLSAKDNIKPQYDEDTSVVTPTNDTSVVSPDQESSEVEEEEEDVNTNTNTYTYTNEFGSGDKTTTVNAIQAEKLSGFSGASNNVFYIDGKYDLYYLELTNLTKTKLASNVNHFDNKGGQITAYYKNPHDVYEENNYVVYKAMS